MGGMGVPIRHYLDAPLAQAGPFPGGQGYFYECRICFDVIPSTSNDNINCMCNNIRIDADAGRLSIEQLDKVWVFYTSD